MNEAVDNNAPINQGVDMYGRQKPDLLSPRECAIIAAQAANEKKATDIMVQQVGDLIGVTEYFVICTASNNRQVDAVVDEIEEQCRLRGGAKPYHIGRRHVVAAGLRQLHRACVPARNARLLSPGIAVERRAPG